MKFLLVFVAMAVTDIFWTIYLLSVEERKVFKASLFAMLLYLSGAFVVTSYVGNSLLIIAAALGSFTGTYVTIWNKKRKSK